MCCRFHIFYILTYVCVSSRSNLKHRFKHIRKGGSCVWFSSELYIHMDKYIYMFILAEPLQDCLSAPEAAWKNPDPHRYIYIYISVSIYIYTHECII